MYRDMLTCVRQTEQFKKLDKIEQKRVAHLFTLDGVDMAKYSAAIRAAFVIGDAAVRLLFLSFFPPILTLKHLNTLSPLTHSLFVQLHIYG